MARAKLKIYVSQRNFSKNFHENSCIYNRIIYQFAIHITHTFLNNPENEYRITLVLCVESQISELILIKPIIYQLKLASNETRKFSHRGNRTKILERR